MMYHATAKSVYRGNYGMLGIRSEGNYKTSLKQFLRCNSVAPIPLIKNTGCLRINENWIFKQNFKFIKDFILKFVKDIHSYIKCDNILRSHQ